MSQSSAIEKDPYVFARPWHRLFPPMLVVSITNACNMRCIHCYYSTFSKLPGYHKSFLPFEIWEKICDETSRWPGVIMNFGTDGEPLLHARLLDMLRYARQCGIYPVNITTNGTLMTKEFNSAIVKKQLLDVINISVDAIRPETYKKIRGGSLSRVNENILHLIGLRQEKDDPLRIQVNIIDQPEAHDEISEFVAFWEPKVDNVMVRTYYDATSVQGETGPNITGRQEPFEVVERWPCQQLWRRFNIAEDGTVRFCVDDWFNKTRLGDVRHKSIAGIWQGDEYNRLRHLHITDRFDKIPYCMKCTEWQGMRWDYDYFSAMAKMLGKEVL